MNRLSPRRRPSHVISLALVFALVLASLVILTTNLTRTNAMVDRVLSKDARMLRLHIDIIRLDELLTHYARAAVSVSDPRYAEPFARRYDELVAELDTALKEAMAITPEDIAREIDQKTNDANNKLVDLEVKSFELVKAGLLDSARTLMYSDEYNLQKKIYAAGMMPLYGFLEQAAQRVQQEREDAQLLNSLAVAAIVLSFGGIVFLLVLQLRSTRQLNAAYSELQGANSELTRSQAELQAANQTLVQAQEELNSKNEELRANEAELLAANDYLMSVQADLRQSLNQLKEAQASLVQAEKMASLGQLVAGVAHEINTPIGIAVTASSHLNAATSTFVEQLASGKISKTELVKYATDAKDSTALVLTNLRRAAELIQSFKKVSVNQSSEERMAFEVNEYLHEVVTTLGPTFRRSPIEIDIQADQALRVVSYPSALSQVVINLLMNAYKHAFADGQVAGRIEVQARALDAGRLELIIRDSGKGIAADVLPRIFDPFFTTKRGEGGSGLGLHIVYNLITQQLGGQIDCESAVGVGTVFRIQFPVEVISTQPA